MLFALLLMASASWGQISISGASPYSYTQNFNGYTATSSGNSGIPTGWTVSGGSGNYRGKGNGSSNSGGIWSYGANGGTDWSLGALYSGSAALVTYSVTFTNNTGATITALTISYDFEGWRYAGGNSGGITCTTSGLPASVATTFSSNYLWTSGATTGSSTKTATLTGLSITSGNSFTINWQNVNGSGSDNGVAVDNFSLQATYGAAAPPAITSSLSASSNYLATANYTISATNSPTSYTAAITKYTDTNGTVTDYSPSVALSTVGASLSNNIISFPNTPAMAAGVYNIALTASNSGGTDSETLVYTRNKINQAISFTSIPTKTYGDPDFNLIATVGSSGLPVAFSSADAAVGTISGNTVTITGTGASVITASHEGNNNYNAATATRILTVNPKAITVLNPVAQSRPYDGTTTATVAYDGLSSIVSGDDVNIASYTADFNNKNVGTAKPVTTAFVLSGATASRYTLNQPTGLTADVTAIPATISGISAEDKTFDGSTTATLAGTAVLNGIISGDDVTLNSTAVIAEFAEEGPGENIPVTVTGYTIEGADVANYTLAQPTGLTASIIDDGLTDQTITFNPLSNVVYGSAPFALTATASSSLTVTYTSSNTDVATVSGNTVTITGVGTTTITASQDGDPTPGTGYSPAIPVTQDLTVTPKALSIINATVVTKQFDGTDVATVTAALDGIVGSDDVSYTYEAIYEDENVGENKDAVAEFELTGTRAFNYTLTEDLLSLTGTITPKEITLSGAAAANKVYDNTNTATITGTLTGVVAGDSVTFDGTGTFADVNVATGIAVTASATLGGTDAANYMLVQPEGLTADITPKGITVTATAADKVYDRTTTAEVTVVAIDGVIGADEVTVAGNGAFNTYDAGNNKPVTTALVLGGVQAANYSLTQPTGITATITPKQITADVTAAAVTDKTYDNTTTATVSGVVINDVVVGDEADLIISTASFVQADAGTGIPVSNFVLSGPAAANYALIQPAEVLLGNIVPATITLNSAAAQNKPYDATDAATITGTLAGTVAGAPEVNYTGIGTFADSNVGTGISVTPAIVLTGAGAGNYQLTQPTGLTADITPRGVTVSATAQSKVYDDTTTTTVIDAAITAGVLGDDNVQLAETTVAGTFNNAAVGNNKPVAAVFTLTGADATNYTVTVQTYSANITPVALTVDITGASVTTKTYDATTAAAITGAVLSGVLPDDTVLATTGAFATANAGNNIPVTILLSGADGANYTVIQPETPLTGTINKKALIATADNKSKTVNTANPAFTITYSGFLTSPAQNETNAAGFIPPVISTDAVTASPVGTYPITLSGGSATNYTFSTLNNGLLTVNPVSTGLITWNPVGQGGFGVDEWAPASIASGLTTQMQRGDNILTTNTAATNGWGGSGGWANTGATTDNNSFYFEINVPAGKALSFTNMVGNLRRSSSGPNEIYVYYAVYPTGGTVPATFSQAAYQGNFTSTNAIGTVVDLNLANVAGLQTIQGGYTVKFRLNPGAGSNGGTFYINGASSPNTFVVNGTLLDLPLITSTLTDSSDVLSTDTYQITATGTPQLAFSAAPLPAGATLNSSTGLISFDGTTPAGVYPITLSATSYYGNDSKILTYTVNKLNQVVTFDPDPIPVQYVGNEPLLLEYNNTAGLPVILSSSDETVATIDASGVVTAVGQGTAIITASNAGNDIYNPVAQTINVTVGAPCFTWLGTLDNNWNNAANWCNSLLPVANSEVIISPSSNNPVINSGIAYANNLTLTANAQLTVNTGATLSVEGTIDVDATATLTVQDNGAILQANVAADNNNNGKIVFHKNTNPLYRLDYTLWSAPVSVQTLRAFSMGTSNNRFYVYDYAYNGVEFDEGYWPVDPLTTSFTEESAGTGYLIRMPNSITAPVMGTTGGGTTSVAEYAAGEGNYIFSGTFNGKPNNGTYNTALSQEGTGYTAVGNPYPSPISLSDFLSANSSKLVDDAGLYFWRKRNNSESESYVTLNLSGLVVNPNNGTTQDEGLSSFFADPAQNGTWLIAPGQGFLIQARPSLAEPSVRFTNSMRRATPGAQAFFRQAAGSASRYWLNLVAQNGAGSQALVSYTEQGTLGLDFGYDSKTFASGVSLYSTAANSKLAIQTRPQFEAADIVPMGFNAPAAGQYTISLDHKDGLFAQGQEIYLKDLQEGVIRNLSQNDYTFTTEAGTFEGRFEVHYQNQALNIDVPVLDANSVIVFKEGNTINVTTGNAMINSVKVFDIRGRQLYSQDGINAAETVINNLSVQQQVLIIEIATDKGTVSKRIVF